MSHRRIILVGKAAAGKNYMREKLEKRGYKYGISYTTRKPRTGETDNKDYHFIDNDTFEKMIRNNDFYEYVNFNNCYYGTSKAIFYTEDVFTLTPEGIQNLNPDDRKTCLILFLDISDEHRKERLLKRSDADKVDERIEADQKDFKNFTDFDIRITSEDF